MNSKTTFFTLLLALCLALWLAPGATAQEFPDVCRQSENILSNCDFNNGLNGWQTFTEAGGADITVLQGGGECHAPLCPAAYIVTRDHFVGGLYQQVPVTAGNNYYANVVWFVFDALVNDQSISQNVGGIGRRVGIDPYGGTDPTSGNIIWSPDNWRTDCKMCNEEQVTATAQADTITVFVRIEDTWRLRAAEKGFGVPPSKDQFWIDDIGLMQVGGQPVVAQQADSPVPTPTLPPTATPVPPTATPPPAEPTATPEAEEPTATPEPEVDSASEDEEATEEEQEAEAMSEPTATPEPTTPAPARDAPPTLTPTIAPSPTNTAQPRPTPTPRPTRSAAGGSPGSGGSSNSLLLGAAGATVCMAGFTLFALALVLGGLVWLYQVGWNRPG